jgi:hypothetical protein
MANKDLQGSLDLLVLKTLSQVGRMHGYGIVQHIGRASDELLRVEEGSPTRQFTVWSRAGGSHRSGRPQRLGAKPSITG